MSPVMEACEENDALQKQNGLDESQSVLYNFFPQNCLKIVENWVFNFSQLCLANLTQCVKHVGG